MVAIMMIQWIKIKTQELNSQPIQKIQEILLILRIQVNQPTLKTQESLPIQKTQEILLILKTRVILLIQPIQRNHQ